MMAAGTMAGIQNTRNTRYDAGLLQSVRACHNHSLAHILPLKQAIHETVRDGDTVALEGFTHLIPFAAGHEIIRQGRRNLTVIRMTPDLIYDQLIGGGCA